VTAGDDGTDTEQTTLTPEQWADRDQADADDEAPIRVAREESVHTSHRAILKLFDEVDDLQAALEATGVTVGGEWTAAARGEERAPDRRPADWGFE
jgi:hypothetical protein